MRQHTLAGIRVAILATDGAEQVALKVARAALDAAGAWTQIVAPHPDRITPWDRDRWGTEIPVNVPLGEARAEDFDALLVPGGVVGVAPLHDDPAALALVRAFDEMERPIAAICQGTWLLAAAGVVRGRRVTAWPALREALRAAGAHWVDAQVVADGRLLTCRSSVDLASFMRPTIQAFASAPRLAYR